MRNDVRFAYALLRRMGARPTKGNVRFLLAWQRAEGTAARFNPLATTRVMGGATDFNSVGVKNYVSFGQGVEATARTLLNGRYGQIVKLMRSGKASPRAMGAAVAASPWGTGAGVLNVLGAGGGGGGAIPAGVQGSPAGIAAGAVSPDVASLRKTALARLTQAAVSDQYGGFFSALHALNAAKRFNPTTVPMAVAPDIPLISGGINGGLGVVNVSPGANLSGKPISPVVMNFTRHVAGLLGRPLVVGTGTNHREFVSGTHRQSAHYFGHAVDIPATGVALTRMGRAALIAAGMSPARARKINGGIFNIGRWQIIFNINLAQGGNHYNHLHIGYR